MTGKGVGSLSCTVTPPTGVPFAKATPLAKATRPYSEGNDDTVEVIVAVLFVALLSGVVLRTSAVLRKVPSVVAVALIVTVTLACGAIAPSWQVMVAVPLQVP